MSAEVQAMPASEKRRSIAPGQVFLQGRIDSFTRNEKGHFTVLQTAAPDPYSMPGLHEVQSKRALGRPGDSVECLCVAGGYSKSATNRQTGESFRIIRNTLRVVEE